MKTDTMNNAALVEIETTLPEYIFSMIEKGYSVKKDSYSPSAYNLTKGINKLMVRRGWMENKFDYFVCEVDSHSINGKIKSDHKLVAVGNY